MPRAIRLPAIIVALLCLAVTARAGALQTLANLTPLNPFSLLQAADGSLIGGEFSSSGVTGTDCGSVYRLVPPASGKTPWTKQVLRHFAGDADGCSPQVSVIDSHGAIYGTAQDGPHPCAANGCGLVFRLTPPTGHAATWGYEVLYAFRNDADGANPDIDLLALPDGQLVGSTAAGGIGTCQSIFPQTVIGCGTVFRLTKPRSGSGAWSKQTLFKFDNDANGYSPFVALVDGNMLYGATLGGNQGCTNATFKPGCGTLFTLTLPASATALGTLHTIFSFKPPSATGPGNGPSGIVRGPAGSLYVATRFGGKLGGACGSVGCGAIEQMLPGKPGAAWTARVVTRLTGGNGADPGGLAADAAGHLYVATGAGGSGPCSLFTSAGSPITGCGTVLRIAAPTAGSPGVTVLHGFTGAGGTFGPPNFLLAGRNGMLFGTSEQGFDASGVIGLSGVFALPE